MLESSFGLSVNSIQSGSAFKYSTVEGTELPIGMLESITDSNNNVTKYFYNNNRTLLRTVFPDLKQESYTWTWDGLIKSKRTGKM